MKTFAIRLLAFAILSLTLAAAPVVTAVYAAPDNDPPPHRPKARRRRAKFFARSSEETAFAKRLSRSLCHDLRAQRTTRQPIPQLKALGP